MMKSNTAKRLSIILPVYNAERYLDKCISSILNQISNDTELIVIDDGSTDQSRIIMNDYALVDNRIRIEHQHNRGVSYARNRGMEISKGKWIMFVDADDYLDDNFCSRLLGIAEKTNVDALLTVGAKKDGLTYSEKIQMLSDPEIKKIICGCLAYNSDNFRFNIDAPWGKIFRSSIIKENGIKFPEKLRRSEDALFCATVYNLAGRIATYDIAGYVHTENEGSICRSFSPDAKSVLLSVLAEEKRWVEKNHPDEEQYLQAVYYRVLPGINECEQVWLLHPKNHGMKLSEKIKEYQRLLAQTEIADAIKKIDKRSVSFLPYKKRLLLYRLHMAWLLILMKS